MARRPLGMPKLPMPPMTPPPATPAKAVMAAPRIKAISTRDYGKGGSPYSGGPNMGQLGAGIGYSGVNPYGT